MKAPSRVWFGIAGMLIGVVLGGVIARWAEFWRWVRSADWSSLPAVSVGTAIPAIAGVVFAQTLAKRSVRTLREVELDTTEIHNKARAAAARREREARRDAWERLFDACKALQALSPDEAALCDAVIRAAQAHDSVGSRQAHQVGNSFLYLEHDATMYVRHGAVWGPQLRRGLPSVVDALGELVDHHQVESMRVPLRTLQKLVNVSSDIERWLPLDSEAIIRAATAKADYRGIVNIGSKSAEAIGDLSQIAHVHRAEPHDATDVDSSVGRLIGLQAYRVSALAVFADLEDLIERDGADDH